MPEGVQTCEGKTQGNHSRHRGTEADTQRYLRKVLGDWEHRMQQTAARQKSDLLHSLTGAVNGSSSKTTRFRRRRKT
jgi:hypothetical protein